MVVTGEDSMHGAWKTRNRKRRLARHGEDGWRSRVPMTRSRQNLTRDFTVARRRLRFSVWAVSTSFLATVFPPVSWSFSSFGDEEEIAIFIAIFQRLSSPFFPALSSRWCEMDVATILASRFFRFLPPRFFDGLTTATATGGREGDRRGWGWGKTGIFQSNML